ncbi:cupin domain-containing protein [Ascidiimonas sp. W6]|uniref:cupin domain-containing protein n=1 Tax=Ascidiimonas meishanensis TaxID=3128903 RepID=UPI0030EBE5ED
MTDLKNIAPKEIIKGFHGRFVHTANNTLAWWEVKKGAVLPRHSHVHEQVTQVLEGSFQLTVEDQTYICGPGKILVIPPDVTHEGIALTDCKIFDLFAPSRPEYTNNKD